MPAGAFVLKYFVKELPEYARRGLLERLRTITINLRNCLKTFKGDFSFNQNP